MMKLTDTHCHLAEPALRLELPQLLQQARQQGICRFIVPATRRQDWEEVLTLIQQPSKNIHIALGIHPWFSHTAQPEDFIALENILHQHPQAWVGEIGLDFHHQNPNLPDRQQQTSCFIRQLACAQSLKRRVIIHNVKATAALITAIKQTGFTHGGIVHAFSGSLEEAHQFTRLGFKIGIGSLLLNPNAKKARTAATQLAWQDWVLETDSPFMLQGRLNTPANVRHIAEIVAQLRGCNLTEVAEQTEKNVDELLHLSSQSVAGGSFKPVSP